MNAFDPTSMDALRGDIEEAWHRILDLYEGLRPMPYRTVKPALHQGRGKPPAAMGERGGVEATVGGRGRAMRAPAACLALASLACATAGGRAPAGGGAYAEVDGLHLYYEVHGASRDNAPPLVLLHGGGSTIQTSFGTLLPLLARTRRVIAFEQQGHGHTADVPDRPFSFAQSARDAVALLRFLRVERADLLGYSNGGHVAIQIALDHPEIVNRLVIVSAMTSRDGTDPQFWESFPHATIDQMPRELQDAYLAAAPHPEELPTFFAKSVKRMLEFQGWPPERLKAIRAPILLLLGDRDVVRPEHAVWLYRWLPDARLCILPDTDHTTIVRRGDVVHPLVEAFLAGGAAAPGP